VRLRIAIKIGAVCAVYLGVALAAQQAAPPAYTANRPAQLTAAANDGTDSVVKPKVSESYRLGPNDSISVRCMNAEEFTDTPFRVDTDGQVTLPMVGRVEASGLTVRQLETNLKEKLSKYIIDPQVVVRLVEARSHPVSVIGAVHQPGVHQLDGAKRLLELLSQAGGLRQDAGQVITLTRRLEWGRIPLQTEHTDESGKFSVAEIDLKELTAGTNPANNVEICPFDVISVPMAELIYVVGEVKKPGGFTIAHPDAVSVLQALSLAEGLQTMAYAKKAKILRQSDGGNRAEIPVDLPRLLAGQLSDIPMMPGDILFVPKNQAKSAGVKVMDAAIQMTTGVIIYRRW